MIKFKLSNFVIIVLIVLSVTPILANSASYYEQQFKDVEVVYAAKLSVKDSSENLKEAIFGVVGLWLPSEIKTPAYFSSYESWRDTLLGSSSILAEESKSFEEVYTEDILKEKYDESVKQCQIDSSKLGEICNHITSLDDLKNYLKSTYESSDSAENQDKQRRKNKILSAYKEEQLQQIYEQQKSLLDKGLWVRDIKLYFEIDGKRMLSDFVKFDFYGNGNIKAIYAKFFELDDWKEGNTKIIPDAEVLITFDEIGKIDNTRSKIVIPPTNTDFSALTCNMAQEGFITPSGEKTVSNILGCKSHCMQLNSKPLLLEGQVEEYDFFKMFWEPAKEIDGMPSEITDLCVSDNLDIFNKLTSNPDCSSDEIFSVVDTTGLFTVDLLKTNDIIHFGWNWEENDKFLWGEWNLANLADSSFSGCRFDEIKTLYKIKGEATEITNEPITQIPNTSSGETVISEAIPSNESQTIENETVKLGEIKKDFIIELATLHERGSMTDSPVLAFIDFDGHKGRLLTIGGDFYMVDNRVDKIKTYYGLFFNFDSKTNVLELKLKFDINGKLDFEDSRISIVPIDKQKKLGVCFNSRFENTGLCQNYKITSGLSFTDLPSNVFSSMDIFEATKTLAPNYCGNQYDNETGTIDGVYVCDSHVRLTRSGYSDILLGSRGEFQEYCTGVGAYPSLCQILNQCSTLNLCK